MTRGHTDYGVPDYSFFAVETPVSDVVAERQGFSRLDNRGRVFWFDDFRNGLSRWKSEPDAGGAAAVAIYDEVNAVGYYGSCKLDPVVNGGSSFIYNHLALAVSKKLGIEVCFYLPTNHGRVFVDFQHNYIDGVSRATSLMIEEGTEKIYVGSGSGNALAFTPADVGYLRDRWITFKLVADFDLGKLVRGVIGNTQIDLSSFTTTSGIAGMSGTTYTTISNNGVSSTYVEPVFIGYVVVSGDEP